MLDHDMPLALTLASYLRVSRLWQQTTLVRLSSAETCNERVDYANQRLVATQAEIEACRAREGPQIAENRRLQTALEASRRQVQASARAAEVTRSRLAEREATQLARMAAREKRRTRVLMESHEQELMGVKERKAVTVKRLERALMLLAAAVVVVVGFRSRY
ncbi:hypothetical protein B0H14DRAFT_2622861 [Mycena olivaceomarginata]|nr:hypothetical protein B0H14DRAFT_2622861 [Mycena olivaceomarginata]